MKTGEYSDTAAVEYLNRVLIERRDNIGRTWFSKVLPLDHFRVENGRLEFQDLGMRYNFNPKRDHQIAWARFDNETEQRSPITGHSGASLPKDGAEFLVADISSSEPGKTVSVYIRSRRGNAEVVGVERKW